MVNVTYCWDQKRRSWDQKLHLGEIICSDTPQYLIDQARIGRNPQRMKEGDSLDSTITVHLARLRGRDWNFELSSLRYLQYKAHARYCSNGDYTHYRGFVTDTDKDLIRITNTLGREVIGSSWRSSKEDMARLIVDFVHSFRYTEKPYYVKYPYETLVEHGGNCVDFSVLGATLLTIAKIPTCFLHFYRHVMLGIGIQGRGKYVELGGVKYFPTEMTNSDYPHYRKAPLIGRVPEDVRKATVKGKIV